MRSLHLLILSLAAGAILLGCASGAPVVEAPRATQTETARLNAWFEARYEEQLAFSPIRTTTLGRKDNYDQIDDFSEAAQDARLAWRRETVEALQRDFDAELLTPEARTSYDLWLYELERTEAGWPYRRRGYVFTQMQSAQSRLPSFLINFHKVESEADMVAYIARIGGVARAIDQLIERARLHAAEGVRPPRFAYDEVLTQVDALTTGSPFSGDGDAPLWADAKTKIATLEEKGSIDAARAAELRKQVAAQLLGSFGPAYASLGAWLREDRPNSDEAAAGVWKLPEGRAFYQQSLAYATTTEMTADQIHDLGLREVTRLRGEMETIKQQVGFEGSLKDFFEFVRSDPQFYFPNTDAGREAYLQSSRDHLDVIKGKLPDFFGLLPKADLVVKRVEAFREQDGAAQHYFAGTPDGSRPGVYYAHLSDMSAMPIPQVEVIAYHEALPGHHMQVSIAQELQGVPEFRKHSFYNSYVEGWALYAELVSKEMGAFEDPYSDFGRLTTEIWRAIRLVVDTGLHDKEWSEEEAVQYFMANSPAAEGQIRSEIRRYLVWPGQATSYKIGMLKILELRDRARTELGDAFDIRAFHDVVLGGGGLPLAILERRVGEWIESQSQGIGSQP